MAAKRAKRPTTNDATPWTRWRTLAASPRGRWLLRSVVGALVFLVVGFVVRGARAQAYAMKGYRLTPASVRIVGLPSWIAADPYTRALFEPPAFARAAGPFSVSIYDPLAEREIASRVESHPLIARASLVTLRYPREASVRVDLRVPVARVTFGGADRKAMPYLLAADHTLLPVEPYRGFLQRRLHPLPEVRGIGVRPPLRRTATAWQILIGAHWEDGADDRVAEAVAAAQTAERIAEDLGGMAHVRRIDVSRFTRTGRLRTNQQHAEVEFEIDGPPERAGGPRVARTVLWGRTSRAAHEVPGEHGYGRKVDRLRRALARQGTPPRIDVRWDV